MNFIKRFKNEMRCRIGSIMKKNHTNSEFKKLQNEWDVIKKNSECVPNNNTEKNHILFVQGILGLDVWSTSISTYLAYGYFLNNYEVSILSCDAALPLCEFNPRGNGELNYTIYSDTLTKKCSSKLCQVCKSNCDLVYEKLDFNYLKLSNFIEDNQLINAKSFVEKLSTEDLLVTKYKNINISEHAYSTTLRLLKRGEINFSKIDELLLLKKTLISAIVYIDRLELFFQKNKFDKLMTVHGVYLVHGLIVDYAKLLNIDVIVYGAPYRKGTLMFSHNKTYHLSLLEEKGESYKNLSLDIDKRNKVKEYLDSKVLGGRENVNYHPNPILEKNDVLNLLNLNKNKLIISLFTNVLWDAQIYYSNNTFKNMLEWLFFTIDYFSNQDKYTLVIRIHPAEKKGAIASKQPIYDEIINRYPNISNNIKIIKPESDISSYTLALLSKATIIYGTKMGLELAYRKIPVIVCGESYSRGKGFSFDIESKEHYLELLSNIEDLIVTDKMQYESMRFTHYWVFQKMIDFKNLVFDVHNQGESTKFFKIKALADIECDESIQNLIQKSLLNEDIILD